MIEVGKVPTDPPIHYLWSREYNATVEITDLESVSMIRASKAYRLTSQEEEGRENWTRNLSKVNDYLKDRGLRFRISIDYVPETSPNVTVDRGEAESLAAEATDLEAQLNQLKDRKANLEKKQERGLESLKGRASQQLAGVETQITQKQERVQEVLAALDEKRERQNQWTGNGVMSTYLFEVSTDAEVTSTHRIDRAIESHLDDVKATHGNPVKQALQGSNFKLQIEEVKQPRILHQLEHIGLANPAVLDQAVSDAPEKVKDQLKTIRGNVAEQFRATALKDLETENGVFQRGKATPTRGIASILTDLEEQQLLKDTGTQPPKTGPGIGTTPSRNKTVGFDPAQHGPHYYIAGSTGTGKTHLKRVLMENVASLGYDLLNIDPSSYQGIGISLPNTDLRAAEPRGIKATHYSHGQHLKDIPSDYTEIFDGVSTLSFTDQNISETAAVTASILNQISSHDFSNNPLFVFLEEADNLTGTVAIEPLRQLVQEGRKFGVHVVLVSQRPKAFEYSEKDIRQETSYILMNRRYRKKGLGRLFDIDATNLERGQAVFVDFVDIPEVVVDTRDTLTRLWSGTPSKDEIQKAQETSEESSPSDPFPSLDNRSTSGSGEDCSRNARSHDLDPKQETVVKGIQSYTARESQAPSQNKLIEEVREDASLGYETIRDILDNLIEQGVVETDTETRYGNEATVYSLN